MSKLFLTPFSVGTLLLFCSCASTPIQPFPGSFYLNHDKMAEVEEVPVRKAKKMVVPPVADESFKDLCSSGKQRVPISYKIFHVLPKIKSGIPLDKANEFRKEALSSVREYVKHLFDYLSDEDVTNKKSDMKVPPFALHALVHKSFSQNFQSILSQDQEGEFWKGRPRVNFFAIQHNKLPEISSDFEKAIFIPSTKEHSGEDPEKYSQYIFMTLWLPDPPNTLIVVARDPDKLFQYTGVSHCAWENGVERCGYEWNREGPRENYSFSYNWRDIKPQNTIFRVGEGLVVDTPVPNSQRHETKEDLIFPLKAAVLFELSLFRNNYTFLFPKEVIDKAFLKDSQREISSYRYNKYGYKNGNLSISDVSSPEVVKRLWKEYLYAFTSVKEASVPNKPELLSFEAQLDLSGFCKYGRKTSDLLSK